MAVTLNARDTEGFVELVFPDESGCIVGSQFVVGIPQYNMIVKYYLKGHADQAALTDEQQTLVDAYFEAVDGNIVLKFKKFLVEEGVNEIISNGPQNFIYAFTDTVDEGHGSNRIKTVINFISVGSSKFSGNNKGKWLSYGILSGLACGFLNILAVGAALLQDFLPPCPTWLKIHDYCKSLNILFSVKAFALAVHVLEKYGRKNFSFKHVSMVLAIFILVIFQVLESFKKATCTTRT